MFPISTRRIMRVNRSAVNPSFLESNVPANHTFEPAMLRADQQGPFFVERFSSPPDASFAGDDDHLMAERGAMGRPLIGDSVKLVSDNSRVIALQLAEDRNRQFRAGNRLA